MKLRLQPMQRKNNDFAHNFPKHWLWRSSFGSKSLAIHNLTNLHDCPYNMKNILLQAWLQWKINHLVIKHCYLQVLTVMTGNKCFLGRGCWEAGMQLQSSGSHLATRKAGPAWRYNIITCSGIDRFWRLKENGRPMETIMTNHFCKTIISIGKWSS